MPTHSIVIKNSTMVREKSPIARTISPSATGSKSAALSFITNTTASVRASGPRIAPSSASTAATPSAFLTISVQPTSVSIVSENMPPTTGTKLSTAYLAARMTTPSIDALHTP